MDDSGEKAAVDIAGIQVAVRVRPLNPRELTEGHRVCVSFDDPSKQVVLTAVDKSTLFQLRGQTAKGYAFDRRYGQEVQSDRIYDECVSQLVENCFKGYNATVLAYGQTGSGKTHTMAGGVGIHGIPEEGVTPRVIKHVYGIAETLKRRAKSGERITVRVYALELYNEELRDLSAPASTYDNPNWGGKNNATGLKLLERPAKDGRIVPEVVGVREVELATGQEMMDFFEDCNSNRATSSTKLNDRSSRSHAIFTITIHRTIVTVLNELDDNFRAKVRTEEVTSKLHLVDLAGSERVKRSGVTGKELKEATHINSGLLALGNVIVALATESESKKKGHVPYRDSKLTRLLQDSLGGNSLTVLISCISPSESDFEETNNTLKYANRACKIKNTPLPNRFTALEEDLLPMLPSGGNAGFGLVQLQALLEEHGRLKEVRERKDKERRDKDVKRLQMLNDMKETETKTPGFQRLRATQYDELRRQMASRNGTSKTSIPSDVVIGDESLAGLRRRQALMTSPATGATSSPPSTPGGPSYMRPTHASRSSATKSMEQLRLSGDKTPMHRNRERLLTAPAGGRSKSSFTDWMAAQQQGDEGTIEEQYSGEALPDYDAQSGTTAPSVDGSLADSVAKTEDDDDAPPVRLAPKAASAGEALVDPSRDPSAPPEVFVARTGPSASKSKFKRPGMRVSQDQIAAVAPEEEEVAAGGATTPPPSLKQRYSLTDEGVLAAQAEGALAAEGAADGEGSVLLGPEEYDEEDSLDDDADLDMPKLLARFRVNQHDTLAVFKANTKEDFKDVIGLLPENTPLPASDKMTYLLARLETNRGGDLTASLQNVAAGTAGMNEAVGPAVGCLMATFGTNMIASCIFDFEDPPDLELYAVDERIELWGLQIPHNSVRPTLQVPEGESPKEEEEKEKEVIHWTSVDRLNMSIGLLYALCNYALDNDVRCGFCVPRPQLLRRWLQAGVKMHQITSNMRLIYPPTAHDYEYYKTSTVAYFMVEAVKAALEKVLSVVH